MPAIKNAYEFEFETEVEIKIPIKISYNINPGQKGIMYPTDSACEFIPPHIEDSEVTIVEGFDLTEELEKVAAEELQEESF